MRHSLSVCCLLVTLATSGLSAQNASGYVFGILRVPGNHASVQVHGLNNLGHIVGELESDGVMHGFAMTSPETLTSIDYPGGGENGVQFTRASGINDHGSIVGSWVPGSFPFYEQGVLDKSGTFHPIAFPGADNTVPTGINNSGIVVGYYSIDRGAGSGGPRGFVFDGTTYTSIEVPGAERTFLFGISNHGKVVGRYDTQDSVSGFVASAESFYASSVFFPSGVNRSSRIIGTFSNPDQTEAHGFLYNDRLFLFDCPGSLLYNLPQAINDRNVIVGRCGNTLESLTLFYAYEKR